MSLRPYQQRAIDMLYDYLRTSSGHPCIEMPTGSGKSHVIAEICKDALQNWPETRILMLTHVKELIEQNAEKLLSCWPDAPLGIYSAGMGIKQVNHITFAGVQSLWRNPAVVGRVDVVIIDEAHTISHKAEGMYRKFMFRLEDINPSIRVIGFTATPFRLGHGMITDEPAIFSDILTPISIGKLVKLGYLAPLRSKGTKEKLIADGVKTRWDYVAKDLQQRLDVYLTSKAVVEEVIKKAEGRRSWLFFCTGVNHAEHVAEILRGKGISAACVTGATPMDERTRILEGFRSGSITAIANMGVLTTGFDHPGIDLIVMMRPTLSPGLYMQMAGRGMRMAEGKEDCLVLDFAGNVERHGPVTAVMPPKRKGESVGIPPSKICPDCYEIVPAQVHTCPICEHEFPPPEPEPWQLNAKDIMSSNQEMQVSVWSWKIQESRKGIPMVVLTYYGILSDRPIREYILIFHDGFAGEKGMRLLRSICDEADIDVTAYAEVDDLLDDLNRTEPPGKIIYKMDGKYPRVLDREWIAPAKEDAGMIVEREIFF